MKIGPKIISKAILERVRLLDPPRPAIEIIVEIIIESGQLNSPDEARERAEKWLPQVLIFIRQEIDGLLEIGRTTRCCLNSSSEEHIQGACFPEPRDSEELKASKVRRARANDYFTLLQNLDPTSFENLCAKIIGLLGIQNPVVTKRAVDDGIDFYGKLALGSAIFPEDLTQTIQKQLNVWIIGQAKHYKSIQSGTAEIRELVGSILLARAQVFGNPVSPLANFNVRVADPVFSVLITTGTISRNAWSLIAQSGVLGMDGDMVAAFLADRKVGQAEDALNEDAFLAWLNS